MSFKKYIDQIRAQQKVSKPLIKKTRESIGTTFDRGEAIKILQKVRDRYVPPIDFSSASNFAFYGSAEEYYTNAINSIVNYYPYDGTLTEKQLWHYSGSFLENFIFDHEYPRTNGYVVFSSDGWGTRSPDLISGYGESSDPQYILFDGGLQIGNVVNDAGFSSNLKFGQSAGNCVEFWIKKSGYIASLTEKEVILDVWNSSSLAASKGKFSVQMDSTFTDSTLLVEIISGSTSTEIEITSIVSGSLIDDDWHHVALNVTYGDSSTTVESYLDGTYQGVDSVAKVFTEVTGNFVAAVGSLVSEDPLAAGTDLGWGKLSASLDDFRFWRGTRTAKDIGIFARQPINGGAQTGSSNISLGVYYKFNEGITTTASTDQIILDYSGRINNGTFYGYTSTARNTDSAFVLSGMAAKETKDPILYLNNPLVSSYRDEKILSSSLYDELNNNSFYNTLPDWITTEDQESSGDLKKLTQIMASALDELYLEVKTFPLIKTMEYYNDKITRTQFAQKALNSSGFIIGRILQDETDLASIYDTGDSGVFLKKLEEVKRIIYSNLYNNSVEIFKTKGTVESLRNALRCFGVDNELINLSIYEDNSIIQLNDKRELYAEKYKFINFSTASNNDGIVFPSLSGTVGTPFVSGTSGTADPIEARMANTYECQAFLPKYPAFGEPTNVTFAGLTASMFGVHGVVVTSSTDNGNTFHPDDAGFQVYAVRNSLTSKKVKFVLTSSVAAYGSDVFPSLETGFFEDSYDNETWTTAVTIKPIAYGVGDLNSALASGSASYTVNFRGYNVEDETVYSSFNLSASMHSDRAIKLLSQNRKPYYGANRTNFTSSVLTNSDLNIGFFRLWLDDLSSEELISHAKDPRNAGRDQPYENFLPLSNKFSGAYVPKIDSIIMNIGTENITSSDASGQFALPDVSSGSYKTTGISYLNAVLGGLYQSKGYGFTETSTNVYNSRFFTVGKTINPENFGELSGVQILTEDDLATKSLLQAKIAYFTIEKSAQHALNRDIISFFSALTGFNELIGNPINKYRMEYKDLKKLATQYFSTVISKRTSVAFFEYYKWLDNSINDMLINLLPASLNGSDRIYNVIESHILERNKYQYQLPTIEFRTPDPIATASGSNTVKWKFAHHPLNDEQSDNCYWWKYKAERDNSTFSSTSSAAVLSGRTAILSGTRNTQERRVKAAVKDNASISKEIHGGINFGPNKKLDYYKGSIYAKRDAINWNFLAIPASKVVSLESCDDNLELFTKRKLGGQVTVSRDEDDGSKLQLRAPLNIFSASVGTGSYVDTVYDAANPNEVVTNLHHDVFGPTSDQPLQGTFTSQRVGGSTSRKIRLTDNLTTATDRPERFQVDMNYATDIFIQSTRYDRGYAAPVDQFYQDPPVRAPVNIKNIKTIGAALGNFSKNYEVVQTGGKAINNLALADLTGVIGTLQSPYISGAYDFPLVTGTKNQTVFVERFSAPGGPDTAGPFLDPVNREFSAYNDLNYRNSVVRDAWNSLLKYPSSFGGYQSSSNDLSASIHKVESNTTNRMELSGGVVITGTLSDNGFVTRMIPARDLGYSWITASTLRQAESTLPNVNLPIEVGYATSSSDILFCSSSDAISVLWSDGYRYFGTTPVYANSVVAATEFLHTDFAGLNIHIYEPFMGNYSVGFSDFTLTWTGAYFIAPATYFNLELPISTPTGGLIDRVESAAAYYPNWFGPQAMLNSLLLHRNGPYGYCTWKQLRVGNNPLARALRKNNIITYQPSSPESTVNTGKHGEILISNGDSSFQKETAHFSGTEPAVVKDYSILFIADLQPDDNQDNSTLFALPYNSQKRYFFDKNLEQGLTSPKQKNQKSAFEKFYDFYTSGLQTGIKDTDVKFVKYSHQIYPYQKYSYLGKTLLRDIFVQTWRDVRSDRSLYKRFIPADPVPVSSPNSMGFDLVYNGPDPARSILTGGNAIGQSIAALDTGQNLKAPTGAFNNGVAAPGSIWAHIFQHTTSSTGGTQYMDLRQPGYPPFIGSCVVGGCDAAYDPYAAQNTTFGILRDPKSVLNRYVLYVPDIQNTHSPWDDTARSAGMTSSFGPILELPFQWDDHGFATASATDNYASNYGFFGAWTAPATYGKGPSYYDDHPEFSEYIKLVGKDHTLLPEYRISDHVPAFYTTAGFDDPTISSLSLTGSLAALQTLTPFVAGEELVNFAPIYTKYNTKLMKPSKLRLKFDVITKLLPYKGFYPAERTVQLAQLFSSSVSPVIDLAGTDQSFRTAMQPYFMPGILYNSIKAGLGMPYACFTDVIPIKSVLARAAATAVENVIGDVTNTSFTRLPFEEIITLDQLGEDNRYYDMFPHQSMSLDSTASQNTVEDPFYSMAMSNFLASTVDFCLENKRLSTAISKKESLLTIKKGNTFYAMDIMVTISSASANYNAKRQGLWEMKANSGWGPLVSSSNRPALVTGERGTDFPWRPSWGQGSSSIRLEFTTPSAMAGVTYTLEQIQQELTATFLFSADPQGAIVPSAKAQELLPSLTESINCFGLLNGGTFETDANGKLVLVKESAGTGDRVWAIQPKWETPFLTRNSSDYSSGIWKTLCELPDPATNGCTFLLKIANVPGKASLRDELGFPKQITLGSIAKSTLIEEAIVCIPYLVSHGNPAFFFTPHDEVKMIMASEQPTADIGGATPGSQGPGIAPTVGEWTKLDQMLDKYVFPPKYDWKRNGTMQPLGMIVKEYNVALDKEDISLFWQNLPPKPLGTFDLDTSYVDIDLEKTKMFSALGDKSIIEWAAIGKVRWIVFKVKKRAPTNYFAMTIGNPQTPVFAKNTLPEFKGSKYTEDDFGYNYPYDFCSVVETAKITAEVDFVSTGEVKDVVFGD